MPYPLDAQVDEVPGTSELDRAARLDESLDLMDALWTGEPATFRGEHLIATDVTMLPRPAQRPRIPVWCGGRWPAKAPFRRAARWDGVMPTHTGCGLGETMPPDELLAAVEYTRQHRTTPGPFDVALEGRTAVHSSGVAMPCW